MKDMPKLIFTFIIALLVLPICFGVNVQRQAPDSIEEPGLVEVILIVDTEGHKSIDLVELLPAGTELLNWTANAQVELEIETENFNHFGEVTVYRWNFNEINQDEITVTYEFEIEDYEEFKTRTMVVHKDGFSSENYSIFVGDVPPPEVDIPTPTEITEVDEEFIWHFIIISIIVIGIISGAYYYKYHYKNKKSKK